MGDHRIETVICTVMDEPLGGMGVPGKVNVKGKAVFICCGGCAKKLAADPDKYLAALKQEITSRLPHSNDSAFEFNLHTARS